MAIVQKDEKGNVTAFSISRRRHLRGTGEGYLRNEAGSMCCLGHFARACGVDIKDMESLGMPSDLADSDIELPKQYKKLTLKKDYVWSDKKVLTDNSFSIDMAAANDDVDLTRTECEAKIIEGFKKKKIDVTFTG